jgi:hypothetical protein
VIVELQAKRRLERLASWQGVTHRIVLERLLAQAERTIVDALPTEEQSRYYDKQRRNRGQITRRNETMMTSDEVAGRLAQWAVAALEAGAGAAMTIRLQLDVDGLVVIGDRFDAPDQRAVRVILWDRVGLFNGQVQRAIDAVRPRIAKWIAGTEMRQMLPCSSAARFPDVADVAPCGAATGAPVLHNRERAMNAKRRQIYVRLLPANFGADVNDENIPIVMAAAEKALNSKFGQDCEIEVEIGNPDETGRDIYAVNDLDDPDEENEHDLRRIEDQVQITVEKAVIDAINELRP